MAKHSINIVVRTRDEAKRKFGRIDGFRAELDSMLKKAAAAVGSHFGARQIAEFLNRSADNKQGKEGPKCR